MKKSYLFLLFISLLSSCSEDSISSSFIMPTNPNETIIEGNKEDFIKKINLANEIFVNSQSNIELNGYFSEKISENKILKENGIFEILLSYTSQNVNNKKTKEIHTAAFKQTFFNPSKNYNEELECFISGPILYQHIINYDNQKIYLESKTAEVITKDNIRFLKDYLLFMPFNLKDFSAKKETFSIKNNNIYCCKMEIDSSSLLEKNLTMFYDIEFEIINGFYKSINYKRYYNINNYPSFNMDINIAFSNKNVEFPSNLYEYSFEWEDR